MFNEYCQQLVLQQICFPLLYREPEKELFPHYFPVYFNYLLSIIYLFTYKSTYAKNFFIFVKFLEKQSLRNIIHVYCMYNTP